MASMLDKPPEPIEMKVFQGGGGSAPDLYQQPSSPIEMNVYKGGAVKEPLKYDEKFFEKQEGAGCGRHALNNLLGGEYFTKDAKEDKIDDKSYDTLEPPVSLKSMCLYLQEKQKNIDIIDKKDTDCPDNENYDVSVLEGGLNSLGYSTQRIMKSDNDSRWNNTSADDEDVVGYLVNTNQADKHWVAWRRIEGGQYKYVNSLTIPGTQSYTDMGTLEELKEKYKESITVVNGTRADRGVIEVKFTGKTVALPDYSALKEGPVIAAEATEEERAAANAAFAAEAAPPEEKAEAPAEAAGPEAATAGPEATTAGPEATTAGPEATTAGPEADAAKPSANKKIKEEYSDETIILSNGMRVRRDPKPDDIKNLNFTPDEELFFTSHLKFDHPIIRDYLTSSNDVKERFYEFWKLYITYDGTDRFTLMTYTEGRKIQKFMKEVLEAYGDKLRSDSLNYLLRQNGRNTSVDSDPLTEWDLMVVEPEKEEGKLEEGQGQGQEASKLPKRPKYAKNEDKYQEYEEDFVNPPAPVAPPAVVEAAVVEAVPPADVVEADVVEAVPPADVVEADVVEAVPPAVSKLREFSIGQYVKCRGNPEITFKIDTIKDAPSPFEGKPVSVLSGKDANNEYTNINEERCVLVESPSIPTAIIADIQKISEEKQAMVNVLKTLSRYDDRPSKIVKRDEVAQSISEIVRVIGSNGTTPQEQIETILDTLTGTPDSDSLSNYDYFDFNDTLFYFNKEFFETNKDKKIGPASIIQYGLEEGRTKTFKTMNFLEQLIRVDVAKFDVASQERIQSKLYTFFMGIMKGRRRAFLKPFFVPVVEIKKPSFFGRLVAKIRGVKGGATKKVKKSNGTSSRTPNRTSRKVRSK